MSSMIDADSHPERRSRGLFWALLPVGLLSASSIGLLVMATIARRDPSFALEADYYQRAVRWDGEQAQWAQNARLGYGIEASTEHGPAGVELAVVVRDRAGRKLTGAAVTADAFANVRAAEIRRLTLREGSDGIHRASLGPARSGLWEFRFVVTRENERFTQVVRSDVPGESSPR